MNIIFGYVHLGRTFKSGILNSCMNSYHKNFSKFLQKLPLYYNNLIQNRDFILENEDLFLLKEQVKTHLLSLLPQASNEFTRRGEIHYVLGKEVYLQTKGSLIDKDIRFWHTIYKIINGAVFLSKKLYWIYAYSELDSYSYIIKRKLIENNFPISSEKLFEIITKQAQSLIEEPNRENFNNALNSFLAKQLIEKINMEILLTEKGLIAFTE